MQVSKKRQGKRRSIEVWTPEEFLARTSWYRFGPFSPKRQAHEIIKLLLAEVEALRCAAPTASRPAQKTWTQKVKR